MACWPFLPMMSLGPTAWMAATFMVARPCASTGPASGPWGFHRAADDAIVAEVRQSVHDLEGKPLQGQTPGLKNKTLNTCSAFETQGDALRDPGCRIRSWADCSCQRPSHQPGADSRRGGLALCGSVLAA